MGVRTIEDNEFIVMYDSITMQAFGPVFYIDDDEDVDEFLEWLDADPRPLSAVELRDKVEQWRREK